MVTPVQTLNPSSFLNRQPGGAPDSSVDKTNPAFYNTARPNPTSPDPTGRPISRTVRDEVRSPEVAVTAVAPATGPTTAPTAPSAGGNTTGVDLVIGSVLGVVDKEPIYADKVLAVLDRPLQAEARKYDEARFRQVAADLIQRQVMEFIHADVEFTAAKRNLESKDSDLATQETVRWRLEQIAHAGGSVELAKQKAVDNNTTLEEMCEDHYRLIMTQLFYQRRVIPQIQISASDIRQYYEDNRDKEFTQPAQVHFRVIRIDKNSNGPDAAINKIKEARDRIAAGADFADVAGEVNDDPALLKNHGDPQPGQWMSKNAFVSDAVDSAVWTLQPGQMTKIIDDRDSLYLAKLEARQGGTTQPFEDEDVQDKIRETLRRQQFNVLREQIRDELEKKAAIRLNPDMMQVALDMVMQRYPRWSGVRERVDRRKWKVDQKWPLYIFDMVCVRPCQETQFLAQKPRFPA